MYYNNQTEVFLNGNFLKANDAQVSLYAQTLHYGSGVFEGMRSYSTANGTSIFKCKEHFERLHYSASKMHIKLNYTVNELSEYTYLLLKKNNLSNAYIRPLVYLGENMSLTPTNEVNIFIAAWEWANYLGDKLLKVMISSYQRPHPQSCHVDAKVVGHYTNSILATTEAKSKGFDEALLLDHKGFVAEGPGANFFYEKGGKLYTAPIGNILPGITRSTVFELASELGVKVEEKPFTVNELKNADSAFFCGTAAEIAGIESVDNYQFPKRWENSFGCILQAKYKNKVLNAEHLIVKN